ncbi:MAG: hypothetical protein M1821_004809 [Bathelium mastoideum]|nr:MAG: hypothetical protein M1821_004809 [Bathelium mastoideum]
MSPTKASLARFNPDLLNQTTNASSSHSRSLTRNEPATKKQNLRDYVLGARPTDDESPTVHTDEREEVTQTRGPTDLAESISYNNESYSGSQEVTSSPSRPQPLAPSTRTNVMPTAETVEEEADLPATPQGLENPEYDPPPRGILFSSPSKRPRRSKSLAQKLKSSPLKPINRPSPASQDNDPHSSPTRRSLPDSQNVDVIRLAESVAPSAEPTRTVGMSDELRHKIRRRDKLKDELKSLTKNVESFETTIAALDNEDSETASQELDIEHLMALINPEEASNSNSLDKPLPISQALLSFGPFSNLIKAGPIAPTDTDEDIPSHAPIELDDPLPRLRVFTPFTFSSQMSAPSQDSDNMMQTHIVQIRGPQKLFHARIQMTINTQHECISSLSVCSLPPWAETELGAWIRSPCTSRGPTENDVSSICWAMGSYWEMAVKRAKCWVRCQDAFPRLLSDLSVSTKSQAKGTAAVDGGRGDEIEDTERTEIQLSPSRIRQHLGRRSLTLRRDGVLLEVRWVIGFDWTGEAESEVSVDYACPEFWHKMDNRKSLKKIPETFQSLVQNKGVFEAVRVMAGLLFSED